MKSWGSVIEVVLIVGLILLIIWVVKPLDEEALDLALRVLVPCCCLARRGFTAISARVSGCGSIPSALHSRACSCLLWWR